MPYYERNLPHWTPQGSHIFLTWRLYGSLPLHTLNSLRADTHSNRGKKFARFDRLLDAAAFGPLWLNDARLAKIVLGEILNQAETGSYNLHSYVILPNHVHLLVEPKAELCKITQAIKGRSAFFCNRIIGRRGLAFWQQESFDHWVRSATSFGKIRAYIEMNPVSAGLVKNPYDWPWSSAYK
jgi:REP element-mobilizing transposase RayT